MKPYRFGLVVSALFCLVTLLALAARADEPADTH